MAKTTIEMRIKFTPEENVSEEIPRFHRFFEEHNITLLEEKHTEQMVIFSVDCNNQFIESLTDLVDIEELGIECAKFEIDLKPVAKET